MNDPSRILNYPGWYIDANFTIYYTPCRTIWENVDIKEGCIYYNETYWDSDLRIPSSSCSKREIIYINDTFVWNTTSGRLEEFH